MCKSFFAVATLAVSAISMAQDAPKESPKVVLGRYAQVRYDTGIHALPRTSSHTYYRAHQNQYLVVKPAGNGWLSILMENGQVGYGLVDAIEMLPYEVVRDANAAPMPSVSSRSRSAVARYSLNFVGTPYKWGGNDENAGIDCSGFVQKMYGKIGLSLPRTAAEQAMVGQPITRLEDLRAGDRLYFWDKKRNKIGHTGMYLGNAKFVHSSSGHKGVATDDLRSGSWLKILVAARR